jgi:enediyne biosynthesis protein E4
LAYSGLLVCVASSGGSYVRIGVVAAAIVCATVLVGATIAKARSVSDIPVTFEDVSAELRVQFENEHSPTSNKYLVETMGGGVALLDYDNDGRLDIFFANGAKLTDPMPPGARPDKSDPKFWNRLFHQNADGTFTDVTGKAGVSGNPAAGYSMGVAVGDYDNDGFETSWSLATGECQSQQRERDLY